MPKSVDVDRDEIQRIRDRHYAETRDIARAEEDAIEQEAIEDAKEAVARAAARKKRSLEG
jgi:hypothetical protein